MRVPARGARARPRHRPLVLMIRPPANLEPAERNPRKLWLTAAILVAVAVLSGVVILIAYQRLIDRQAGENRAPYLTRLEKNFAVVRQDGSAAGLLDLTGEVWLITPASVADPAASQRSLDVLQRLDAAFSDRDDLHFVVLTIDPDREGVEQLAAFGKARGLELPRWWLGAAGREFTHTFLKNQLRYGMLPTRRPDGSWLYDTSIKLISRERHVRGSFDFDGAAAVDARMVADGKEPVYLVELEKLLHQRIAELLAETPKP